MLTRLRCSCAVLCLLVAGVPLTMMMQIVLLLQNPYNPNPHISKKRAEFASVPLTHRPIKDMLLLTSFFPSLLKTLEPGYFYGVYLGYDVGDPLLDAPGAASRCLAPEKHVSYWRIQSVNTHTRNAHTHNTHIPHTRHILRNCRRTRVLFLTETSQTAAACRRRDWRASRRDEALCLQRHSEPQRLVCVGCSSRSGICATTPRQKHLIWIVVYSFVVPPSFACWPCPVRLFVCVCVCVFVVYVLCDVCLLCACVFLLLSLPMMFAVCICLFEWNRQQRQQ
jgi:hypothetical protein